MKIRDTSPTYRTANFMRGEFEPPMENGCDILGGLLWTTLICLVFPLAASVLLSMPGMLALVAIGVEPPENPLTSYVMGFGTVLLIGLTAASLFWAGRRLCKAITVEVTRQS